MRRLALPTLTLLAAALLPSCAYMQTHKNIKEAGRSYKGYQLTKPTQLYRSGNTWYIAAHPAEYRKSYDIIHDNVFRKTNEPGMTLLSSQPQLVYHAISGSTATVLLRPDGYAESASLAREIAESSAPWLNSLPQTSVHPIKAQVEGEPTTAITYEPSPAEVPFTYRLLSGLDLLVVDVPGTVAYNIAVPVIAPFVFFHEFLSE